MSSDRLARALAESLARHQSRGLVDGAAGIEDVVIHGRVDLLAVAEDALVATLEQLRPARKSWAGWFIGRANARRQIRRQDEEHEKLARQLENGLNPAESAIARLRIRELDYPGSATRSR